MKNRRQEKVIHLYRGAPITRGWSKYKRTDQDWTLCGIRRSEQSSECTDDIEKVTCYHCRDLAGLSLPATSLRPARQNQNVGGERTNSAIAAPGVASQVPGSA